MGKQTLDLDRLHLPGGQADLNTLARMGAALWTRIGKKTGLSDLAWALGLLGSSGDRELLQELTAFRVIDVDGVLQPEPLARWLALRASDSSFPDAAGIVWTLPLAHPASTQLGASYQDALVATIGAAEHQLVLVSPYMNDWGIMHAASALRSALERRLIITVLTHEADDLASEQSQALEKLRREAERLSAPFAVFTAVSPRLRTLHAKLVVADSACVLLGSANLTGSGLEGNLEAGVVLGSHAAAQVLQIVWQAIEAGLVRLVYSTWAGTWVDWMQVLQAQATRPKVSQV